LEISQYNTAISALKSRENIIYFSVIIKLAE
jgi:hypothetical protein